MTEKIYDQDPRILEFEGTVISCEYLEKKKLYEVILDRTAFFPEEGGQMPDKGILDGQTVIDVRLKREGPVDTILHHVKNPIEVGKVVCSSIDWAHRFDQMQQHSGEHIVSGLIHKKYGYNNVGFHLGAKEVTLDFDGNLTLEQLREIEDLANQAITENFKVLVTFPDKESLKSISYRSKIEIPGQVRLVEFPGYDICACCAPHVERSGQIGIIKITGVMVHRGGVRVNILCGNRARADYSEKQDNSYAISVMLSAKQEEIPEAVKRLMGERDALKQQIITLQTALLDGKIAALPSPEECPDPVLCLEGIDAIAARNAANLLAEKYPGYGIVLVGNDEKGYRYVAASRSKSCKELSTLWRKEFGAKGGGSDLMTQGTIQAELEKILLSVNPD